MTKLNLIVGKGSSYDKNNYSLKFSVKNYGQSSIAFNKLQVVAYGWMPYFNDNLLTKSIKTLGIVEQFQTISNGSSSQNGSIDLNTTQSIYTIFHNPIDYVNISPIVTLVVPYGGSQISPISISNRTLNSFDIVLDSPPPTIGFSIAWNIPSTIDSVGGISFTPDEPTISLLQINPIIKNGKLADTKIIISWPTSTLSLPNSYILQDVEINVYDTQEIIDTSSWYSHLEEDNVDNGHLCLFYDNVLLEEYKDNYTKDSTTGVIPFDDNDAYLILDSSVYISNTLPNPIATGDIDKDTLCLYGGSEIRRSLVKVATNTLPISANNCKNSILRFISTGISNASNFSGIALYRLKQQYSETQTTFIKATNSVNWTTSGSDYYDTPIVWYPSKFTTASVANKVYIDFDISSYVNDWILNPSTNYGMVLKLIDETKEEQIRMASSRIPIFNPVQIVSYVSETNAIPQVAISNTQTFIIGNSLSISATSSITSGSITNIDVYYSSLDSNEKILLASLSEGVGSITLPYGDYNIYLKATSDLGVENYSIPKSFTFIPSNQFVVSNNPNYSNSSGASSVTLSATLFETFRYRQQKVVLTSASYNYPQVISNNGLVNINLTNVQTSAYNFSATITNYDNQFNSIVSVPFQNYNQIVSYNLPYDLVKLGDGSTFGTAKYVPTTFNISATIQTDNVNNYVEFWEVDKLGRKIDSIGFTAASPYSASINLEQSTKEYNTSNYKYIQTIVNGKTYPSQELYVKNNSIPSINLLTSTSNDPISLAGALNDYDTTNTLIYYSPTAKLYENSNYLGDANLITSALGYEWNVDYNSPETSSTYYEIQNEDNYGFINQNTLLLPGIIQTSLYHEIVLSNLFTTTSSNIGSISIVSASNIILSAYNNLTDIKQSYFDIFDGTNNTQVAMSVNKTANVILESGKRYTITSNITTNGLYYTSATKEVIFENGPTLTLNLPFCETCYCNKKSIPLVGNCLTPNKNVYSSVGITYTRTTIIYDTFNNTIGTIPLDGDYVVNWAYPTEGATSIRIETTDSFGGVFNFTKQLPKIIDKTPTLVFISPV